MWKLSVHPHRGRCSRQRPPVLLTRSDRLGRKPRDKMQDGLPAACSSLPFSMLADRRCEASPGPPGAVTCPSLMAELESTCSKGSEGACSELLSCCGSGTLTLTRRPATPLGGKDAGLPEQTSPRH